MGINRYIYTRMIELLIELYIYSSRLGFRSNSTLYSPQMIEKMDSKWLTLATAFILGQPPRQLLRQLLILH